MASSRSHWGSRAGFILAAAGSAVGLGNIWKFPYITGVNGGGLFVLIYLAAIALVGLPIMMAEIFVGRTTQISPVGAFRKLSRPGSPWLGVGWLGVAAGFVILSYYSVVAGWALHYTWLSATHAFMDKSPDQIAAIFSNTAESPGVYENATLNLFWHVGFMVLCIGIVIGGIRRGLERWAKILMPLLFLMMVVLMVRAMSMEGFSRALSFVFAPHSENLTAAGVLEAVGHAFFTLSLGMGAMITYGSYLRQGDDLVTTSITIGVLDTAIALMSCLVIFPIIFTFGMDPSGGPGLVFVNLPIAFSQLPGGSVWAVLFFILLTFAALTSAISLLEVTVAYFIDEKGWSRRRATLICGGAILLLGIPAALSGSSAFFGGRITELTSYLGVNEGHGFNWFDFFDYLASNWMLPLGGLGLATFVAWRVGGEAREMGFKTGTKFGNLYWGWVQLLRYVVPIGVIAVLLYATGILHALGLIEG